MCYHSYFFVLDSPCFSMCYLRDDLKWGCCQQADVLKVAHCMLGIWQPKMMSRDAYMHSTLDSTIDAFLRPAKGRLIIQASN